MVPDQNPQISPEWIDVAVDVTDDGITPRMVAESVLPNDDIAMLRNFVKRVYRLPEDAPSTSAARETTTQDRGDMDGVAAEVPVQTLNSIDAIESHTNAKGLYGKAFPHLNALVEIFAEDRANGKGAASLVEELEEIEKEDEQEKEEENQHNTAQENDQQQSNQSESNSGKGRRKRIRSSSIDIVSGESSGDSNGLSLMANSFSKFVTGTLDHFEAVLESLTQEADVNKHLFEVLNKIEGLTADVNKHLFEVLNKIEGLTEDEVIDAASIILDSSTKTKGFLRHGGRKTSQLCEEHDSTCW
ncbi:uncharacterized protein LOC113283321 [Papaver somniferum]|uniref:uncharacterized protein LOC113283321 n=1 Tax=Papaver somniferum TaxID=3469 RepID=UPI000E704117|nr:uncharacterized protein LOC113283321 [Papaver somniferum]